MASSVLAAVRWTYVNGTTHPIAAHMDSAPPRRKASGLYVNVKKVTLEIIVKLNQTRVSIRNVSSAELIRNALTVYAYVMMATRVLNVI